MACVRQHLFVGRNEKPSSAVVGTDRFIYVRSSISAQQTRINIHLSSRGQNNSHHAALLSTHCRGRSVCRPPSLWQSAGINDISGYTHLTNDNQLVNFNNHLSTLAPGTAPPEYQLVDPICSIHFYEKHLNKQSALQLPGSLSSIQKAKL